MCDPHVVNNGRSYAASLGITPRQHSCGGKKRLGQITSQGDGYTDVRPPNSTCKYFEFRQKKRMPRARFDGSMCCDLRVLGHSSEGTFKTIPRTQSREDMCQRAAATRLGRRLNIKSAANIDASRHAAPPRQRVASEQRHTTAASNARRVLAHIAPWRTNLMSSEGRCRLSTAATSPATVRSRLSLRPSGSVAAARINPCAFRDILRRTC